MGRMRCKFTVLKKIRRCVAKNRCGSPKGYMDRNKPSEVRKHPSQRFNIEVANQSLAFVPVSITDATLTGAQLASAAGHKDLASIIVLQILSDGSLEDIGLQETVQLDERTNRFIIVKSDRTYRFVLNGQRLEWPCPVITGAQIRILGQIEENHSLFLQLNKKADREIEPHNLVNLDAPGVEELYSVKRVWKLNVQGVIIDSEDSTITAKDAMQKAGFDTTAAWIIILKYNGHPKQIIALDTVIDLTQPGIEKLRLTPAHVDNGGSIVEARRDFGLLPTDEFYLNEQQYDWETFNEAGKRWLLIKEYPLPEGYTVGAVKLAIQVPPLYPKAQLDMFYTDPPLALSSGVAIPANQVRAVIEGTQFHGWSRHRNSASAWNPANDSVITHLALIEGALNKEVGLD